MEGLETMLNNILHVLQQLHSRTGLPACSSHRSPNENIWLIMKQKIGQRRPRTVEQTTFPSKRSSSWFLSFQMFMDWMPHSSTHRPVLTDLIRVAMKCYFFSFKIFGLFSRFYCEYIIGVFEICKTSIHPSIPMFLTLVLN